MPKKWYVVFEGTVPGVYEEWDDCVKQVNGFKGNFYKGYKTKEEAEARYNNHLLEKERDMKGEERKMKGGGEEEEPQEHHHRCLHVVHGDCVSVVCHSSVDHDQYVHA